MYLYKYRNIGNINTKELDINLISLLSNGEFYLSDPRDFNDPFDCAFDFDIKAGKQEIERFYNGRGFSKNEIKSKLESKNIEEIKEELLSDFLMKDFTKVYCLSKTYKSSLMWAHYAQKHYGVCVGFKTHKHDDTLCMNISDSQFIKIMKEIPNNLVPLFDINYTTEKLTPIDIVKNGTEGLFQHTITKSLDWKYEEEMRLVFPTASIIRNPFHIKRSQIAEIIFGLRTPDVMQDKIIKIVSDQEEIVFYKMKMIKGSYEIQKEKFA